MTLAECKQEIAYIASAYPRFYSAVSRQALDQQALVWTDILQEYSLQDVHLGVKGYMCAETGGFPPSPGQIVEYVHKAKHPTDRIGPQAWALVRKAVRSSGWDATAAFNTLPPLVQQSVGSAESLRAMARMDVERFETVAQSNFLRTYEAVVRRAAIERKLPSDVQRMIAARGPALAVTEKRRAPEPPKRQAESVPAPEDLMCKLRSRLK